MRVVNLKNRDYDAKGEYCHFFNFGRFGYKLYQKFDVAKSAYVNQKTANKFGIGPKTFGFYKFIWFGNTYYGYKTQVVGVLANILHLDEWKNYPQRDTLRRTFSKIGLDASDIHRLNAGFIAGSLVSIDFDPEMCGVTHIKNRWGKLA